MPRRQDSFGYGVTIPATTARVVDTAVEILGSPDPDELAFLHTVLASTFLPYRDPKTRDDLKAFRQALAVYPNARVEEVDGGLLLKPSRPSIRPKGDGTLPARG